MLMVEHRLKIFWGWFLQRRSRTSLKTPALVSGKKNSINSCSSQNVWAQTTPFMLHAPKEHDFISSSLLAQELTTVNLTTEFFVGYMLVRLQTAGPENIVIFKFNVYRCCSWNKWVSVKYQNIDAENLQYSYFAVSTLLTVSSLRHTLLLCTNSSRG